MAAAVGAVPEAPDRGSRHYSPPVRLTFRLATTVCVAVLAAGCGGGEREDNRAALIETASPNAGAVMDEASFWALIEDVRQTADGDAEAMADELREALADADADQLGTLHRSLVDANKRLYTWDHGDAGELICGFLGDDSFTDFRSWIITRGKDVFEAVAADPDALADVEDVEATCEGGGEIFAAVPSDLYFELVGDYFPADVPLLEPDDPPSGERQTDLEAIRRSLPRLSARFPDDGLGKGPLQR